MARPMTEQSPANNQPKQWQIIPAGCFSTSTSQSSSNALLSYRFLMPSLSCTSALYVLSTALIYAARLIFFRP